MGPIPEAYVKDVILQAGAIIVALFALLGTAVTAYFNYKANKKAKQSEAEAAALRVAEEQKILARQAKEEAAREKQEAAWDGFHRDIKEIHTMIDGLNKDVSIMGQRLDKFSLRVTARIGVTEDSIAKMTQILARNARQNTEMLYMHRKTDERIKAILDMELANFNFTKQTAEGIKSVGRELCKPLPKEDAQAVTEILDHLNQSQDEFIRSVLQAQTEMAQTMSGFLDTREEDRVADIMRHRELDGQPDINTLDDESC